MNSNIIEEGLNYDSIFNRAFDNKILNYVISNKAILTTYLLLNNF